jgi:hypothetical protein
MIASARFVQVGEISLRQLRAGRLCVPSEAFVEELLIA